MAAKTLSFRSRDACKPSRDRRARREWVFRIRLEPGHTQKIPYVLAAHARPAFDAFRKKSMASVEIEGDAVGREHLELDAGHPYSSGGAEGGMEERVPDAMPALGFEDSHSEDAGVIESGKGFPVDVAPTEHP